MNWFLLSLLVGSVATFVLVAMWEKLPGPAAWSGSFSNEPEAEANRNGLSRFGKTIVFHAWA